MRIKFFISFFSLCFTATVFSQTFTVTDNAPFSTTNQSMWGSGGLGLNMSLPLFNFTPPTMTTTVGGISSLAGKQFGAELKATLKLAIGSDFVISGFEGGSIDVNYPTQINNIVPDSFTFDKGDWITIASNHNLQSGASLNTSFPEEGKFGVNMKFGFSTNVHTKICVFSCSTIGLLPPGNPSGMLGVWPPTTFSLFDVEKTTSPSAINVNLGGNPVASASLPLPLNKPNLGICCGSYLDLPSTSTNSALASNCLKAKGSDEYFLMNLNLVKYLKPIPVVGSILSNLNNSYNLPGGATVSYNLFQALFTISNNNVQDFTFCPNVNNTLNFPTEVLYRVKNATSGAIITSGFADEITYHIGDDLEIKYPCNYEFIDITPIYSLDSTENNFRNHTYDSLDFSFNMSALAFSITIPKITVLPPFPAYTICTPYWYPCPSWSNPAKWCHGNACVTTPAFPGLFFGPYSIGFGPLWSQSIPVGSVKYDWFDQSWGLKGFNTVTGTTFRLKPRKYEVTLTGVDILCKNDATGSLTATVLNGVPPYSYEWDNVQVNSSNLAIDSINGLAAGIHFVKVTDANGCSVFASYTLTEPSQVLSVVNLTNEDVKCYNGNDGKAAILMTGGTTPYAYNWSNGGVLDSINNLIAGNYTLTVTDNNNCTLDTNVTIAQPDSIIITATSINDVLCKGDSTGGIEIGVIGGSPTYTYLWSNGVTTQNLSNVPAGNYTVIVSDLNGCSNSLTLSIFEPATTINITSLTGTNVNCFEGNDGAITATVTGGTPSYSYSWHNSTGIQLSANTANVSNLFADTYQLVVTDSNGCSISQSIVITEPNAPISNSGTVTDVKCFAGNDGNITITPLGGTTPYSFAWSNGATTQNTNTLIAGSYFVTITDANSCTFVDTFIVNEPADSLSIIGVSTTDILCFGDATGNIDIIPYGGTLPYSFNWSSGQTTEDINNILAGNYTVTITDSNNCFLSRSYTLIEPLAPINITNTHVNVSCFGGNDGSADITVTGGTQPYTYQWSDLDSVILSSTQQDLTGLDSNIYTVLVTDSNNCQLSQSITITEPTAAVSSTISVVAVNCFTGSDGSINLSPAGGTPPYSFVWSNGATSEDLSGLTTGWYNVVITDSKLCTSSDSIFVSEPSAALSASTTVFDVNCFGGSDGGADLTVTGGTPPYNYLWSNGTTTQNIDSLTAGVYTITVVDFNGCVANSGAIINEPNSLVAVTYTVDSVSCYGYSDGHINAIINGGTMPYQIQWADSMFLLSQYANDLYNLTTGQYTIIVTDGNNCEIRQDIEVFEPDTLTISYTTTDVTCFGGNDGSITTTVLGGTIPYTYFWMDSTITPNQSNLVAGNYSVIVSDKNNCTLTESINITQPQDIKITGEVIDVSCKDETDGEIYVTATGGTGSFMYQWSTGEIGQLISELSAGNYEVYVTDANGCMDTLVLIVNPSDLNCIQVANTITPNGDGLNDTWIIDKMDLYPRATMQVFNKWGNLLFESNGTYIPWDGTYQGKPLPSATYYFILDLKDGSPAITGPITIVR